MFADDRHTAGYYHSALGVCDVSDAILGIIQVDIGPELEAAAMEVVLVPDAVPEEVATTAEFRT